MANHNEKLALNKHALVDTDGRGLVLEPHPASIQDRDGRRPLLPASRHIFPFIQRVFADNGYAVRRFTLAPQSERA
jgi:hypothetical protein